MRVVPGGSADVQESAPQLLVVAPASNTRERNTPVPEYGLMRNQSFMSCAPDRLKSLAATAHRSPAASEPGLYERVRRSRRCAVIRAARRLEDLLAVGGLGDVGPGSRIPSAEVRRGGVDERRRRRRRRGEYRRGGGWI